MESAILAVMLMPFLVLMVFALLVGVDLVFAFPLMWAWNYAVPSLFHLPMLTYWQAFCLLVVATLLVKSPPSTNTTS